jgi:hypothetical protein
LEGAWGGLIVALSLEAEMTPLSEPAGWP